MDRSFKVRNCRSDYSCLSLLDDNEQSFPDTSAWLSLTRVATKKLLQALQALAAAQTEKAALVAKAQNTPPKPQNRIFTSQPTLRQMMNEYNRSAPGLAPLKSATVNGGVVDGRNFHSDSLDLIQISHIPGKILRPARARNADT